MCDTIPICTGNRGLTWRGVGKRRSGWSEVTLSLLHTWLRKTFSARSRKKKKNLVNIPTAAILTNNQHYGGYQCFYGTKYISHVCFCGFHAPDVGSTEDWAFLPTCFSSGAEAAAIFLGGGLSQFLDVSACFCVTGEEPLWQGRTDCPFIQPGEVLGKPGEAAELLLVLCGVLEGLPLDACMFTSAGLIPPDEAQVVAEEAAWDNTVSAGGLCVEEPTDLLAELSDGWGIELPGAIVDSPLMSFSITLVLPSTCWAALPHFSGCPAWEFLWELLRLLAQLLNSRVVWAPKESLLPETSTFFKYFSISKPLISPTHVLLCSVSGMALWSGSGRI